MRTIEVLLFLLVTACFSTLNGQIAVISHLRTGTPEYDRITQELFQSINSKYIRAVVFLGDITNSGDEKEFIEFGNALEKYLGPDDYIIPGMRDIENNPFGYYFVKDQFDGTRVRLDSSALLLAGISNYSPRGQKLRFFNTDVNWLDSLLHKVPDNRLVLFFSPAQLDKTENWYQVYNLLSEKDSKFLFTTGSSNSISTFKGLDEITFKPSVENSSWNYNIIRSDEDSLYLYNQSSDSLYYQWGSLSIKNKEITTSIDTSLRNSYSSEVVWSLETDRNLIAPVLSTENRIYYASLNGEVECVDLKGKSIWKHNIERTITTRPVRDKDLVIITTTEGDLFSINANNGNIVQVIGTDEPLVTDPVLVNVENLDGKFKGVIIGTPSGRMLCYDIYSFELLWDINETKEKISNIYAFEGKLYVTSGGMLYSIDWNNGTLIWKWSAGKSITINSYPETDGKYIYLSTSNKWVYSIDLLLGSTVWKKNDLGAAVTFKVSEDKKELYIKTIKDDFLIVDPLSGKVNKRIKCSFPADNEHSFIYNNAQDIIFSSSDGKIRVIKSQTECTDAFFLGGGFINNFEPLNTGSYLIANDQGTIINFITK